LTDRAEGIFLHGMAQVGAGLCELARCGLEVLRETTALVLLEVGLALLTGLDEIVDAARYPVARGDQIGPGLHQTRSGVSGLDHGVVRACEGVARWRRRPQILEQRIGRVTAGRRIRTRAQIG